MPVLAVEIIVQCQIRVNQCIQIQMLNKSFSNLEIERVFQVMNYLEINMKKMMKQKQDIINYKVLKLSLVICFSVKNKIQIEVPTEVQIWVDNLKATYLEDLLSIVI